MKQMSMVSCGVCGRWVRADDYDYDKDRCDDCVVADQDCKPAPEGT